MWIVAAAPAMLARMDENALRALAAETLEEAGLAGLCREGRLDLACDRLRAAAPDLAPRRIRMLVDEAEAGGQAAPP